MNFENTATLGNGIYTVPDISRILDLKQYKVRRLLNEYWDKRFGAHFEEKYSWSVENSKAINFHTLIEFYIFFQLKDAGVSTQEILKAHQNLTKRFKTPYPFANKDIIDNLHCFGKRLILEINSEVLINLDFTKQLNLKFIKSFTKKIDFNNSNLAERLYPLGKDNSVVVDPSHQFGLPTIKGTNIHPSTIFNLYNNKESKQFIASSYDISLKKINDAIEYCKKVA